MASTAILFRPERDFMAGHSLGELAVTAEPFDDIPQRLAQALTHPVRWRETMLALNALGAERFVETGPGRVLTGLAKRTLKDVELVHA